MSPTFLVLEKVPAKSDFNLQLSPKVVLWVTTISKPLDSVSIAFAKNDAAVAFACLNKLSNSVPVPGPLNCPV